MPIFFRCMNAECGKQIRVKDELAGKRVKCPGCKKIMTAPIEAAEPKGEPAESAPPPEPSPPSAEKDDAEWTVVPAKTSSLPPSAPAPPAEDVLTAMSVVRMIVATPFAALAACLATALILLLGGFIVQLLIWITAGITAVTGRIFVFQAILVVLIVILIPVVLLVSWAAAGAIVSKLVHMAGTLSLETEPARDRKAIAALLCAGFGGLAYFAADALVWSLVAMVMLMGTEHADMQRVAEIQKEMELDAKQQHARQDEGPNAPPEAPAKALERHERQKELKELITKDKIFREAEHNLGWYGAWHDWLRWVGCAAAVIFAIIGAFKHDPLSQDDNNPTLDPNDLGSAQ